MPHHSIWEVKVSAAVVFSLAFANRAAIQRASLFQSFWRKPQPYDMVMHSEQQLIRL